MRRRWITAAVLVFALALSLSADGKVLTVVLTLDGPRGKSEQTLVFNKVATTAPAGVTVPMLDTGGRPVVEVKINGAGPYRLVFDTGATGTVIDPAVTGGSGPTTLKSLEIGSLRFDAVSVNSRTLMAGAPADFPKGVLSASGFPGYLVTFDFPAKTISIVKGALPAADGKSIFQYGADQPLPVAPVQVAGHEYVVHIDTGSPVGVTLPLRYVKELPLEAEPVLIGQARTPAGAFDMFSATVKGEIRLGQFPVADTQVRFSDVRPGAEPGIGNIGSQLLKAFRLTLDSANRRLRFERPAATGRPTL